MKYCKSCVMPNTRPDLQFDEEFICDACNSFREKHYSIDWDSRKKEFEDLINKVF
mgnify:CR=1 FL=1